MRPDIPVPDPNALGAVKTLCDQAVPYPDDMRDDLFISAMNEVVAWHYERNGFYRAFLDRKKIVPGGLRDASDLDGFPLVHANFFKTHESISIAPGDIVLTLTSSGTTGQKSQMSFDEWSIGAGRRMVDDVYEHFGFVSPETETNYLVLNYEPMEGMTRGTANTSRYLTRYAPAREMFYALRSVGGGEHEFDGFGCIEALERFAEQEIPVRIIGFPAFLFFILERMKAVRGKPLTLSPGSLVLTAGGWKGYASREIPRNDFVRFVEDMLGVPAAHIRDSFGAVEHSVPYIECPNHHKHVPFWSRTQIRDVRTLEPVPYGMPGFLGAFAPHMTSAPAVGVLMGDLAVMNPGDACGCGIAAPFFDILGRAGASMNHSCAAAAVELLKRNR